MNQERGVILISTFIVMATLTAIAASFLAMQSVQMKSAGSDVVSHQALWLAEAGMQKAIWNLKTPTGSGGQGENWTTTGTTENLGAGSYTMVLTRYDFALNTNGGTASASSQSAQGQRASKAIDGDDESRWQSANVPSSTSPEEIIVSFPYPLTLNKVRFLAHTSNQRPVDYTWEISTDGSTYTVAVSVTGNADIDRTDAFSAQSNVNHLKLKVTAIGGGNKGVAISILEAIGSKITSTGTVALLNRKIEQTVAADDGSPQNQVAYNETDWNEIVPA
ncbi:MAG: discoidin domain-containing protein [Candidatus Omnitrophica bacterium]|nr:discoidin domain-containing protein [Candidatus Omnitrophota bacterium]